MNADDFCMSWSIVEMEWNQEDNDIVKVCEEANDTQSGLGE